jgi:tetratricopeptide (TPR) repeat protein
MDDRDSVAALVGDLHWQIDQMGPRGIKDTAGNPYNPSYYKRGLKSAIDRGGLSVVEFVQRYVYKPPSGGYKKLEEKDALDLACEALVADPDKPYAHLFTDEDRAAAQKRLAQHMKAIDARKAATAARIDGRLADLPGDLEELRKLAVSADDAEEAIAVNRAILEQEPEDSVAMNRLGRAYETAGMIDAAMKVLREAVEHDPSNAIAARRLSDMERRQRG